MFVPFVKFTVETQSIGTTQSTQPTKNAFEIMMESQQRLGMSTLLPCTIDPKNRKQKLRNDVIDLLDQNGLV